jgi:hypothetical protein
MLAAALDLEVRAGEEIDVLAVGSKRREPCEAAIAVPPLPNGGTERAGSLMLCAWVVGKHRAAFTALWPLIEATRPRATR